MIYNLSDGTGVVMDEFNENILEEIDTKQKSKRSKRKWREIEAFKEKARLKRELMDIDELNNDLLDKELEFL